MSGRRGSDSGSSTASSHSGSQSSGSGEDDEEEVEEPQLKYQRLGSSTAEILKKDEAACLAAHEKFLVLGTRSGMLHVLDLHGDEIMGVRVHSCAVNDMSLDDSGDHVATCSDDGTVVVTNLFSQEQQKHSYPKPMTAVALAPRYAQSPMFAAGGKQAQFIVNTKGWLFSFKDNVVHAGEGPVHAVAWRRSLLAWANNLGVKVYDHVTNERITYVSRARNSAAPDRYRCHLTWAYDDTLLVGWANSVKIGVVKERVLDGGGDGQVVAKTSDSGAGGGGAGAEPEQRRQRYVQIVAMFRTGDFFISGIAPFSEHLVLLGAVEEEEEEDEGKDKGGGAPRRGHRPELRILTWNNEDVSSDALPIIGFESCGANDYRLAHIKVPPNELLYYIVAPRDIVVARPTDMDDHIAWLLARQRFEEALAAAQRAEPSQLRTHSVLDIGERLMQHLCEQGDYERAASFCPRLLGQNWRLWESWVLLFAKQRQLGVVAPFMPTVPGGIDAAMYEMVLNHFLLTDHDRFLRTVERWSGTPGLFNINTIITAVVDTLEANRAQRLSQQQQQQQPAPEAAAPELVPPEDRVLLDVLALLYIVGNQPTRALQVYLQLGREDVFELIEKWDLVDAVRDRVLRLMQLSPNKAVELFLERIDRVPVADVVRQLARHPALQHAYLHALFARKSSHLGSQFHELQVELYARFGPGHLEQFLRNSTSYTLENALEVTRKHGLHKEQVFILSRMGNLNEALSILIEKLCDVKRAIALVEESSDEGLWEELISRSLDSPEFLSDLLEHVGFHNVDLRALISRIPDAMRIPGLRTKLVKIMADHVLQISVRQGFNRILKGDVRDLQRRLHRQARASLAVDGGAKCGLCDGALFTLQPESVTTFFCRHLFHTACLRRRRGRSFSALAPPQCPRCFVSEQEQPEGGAAAAAAAAAAAGPEHAAAPQRPSRRRRGQGAVVSPAKAKRWSVPSPRSAYAGDEQKELRSRRKPPPVVPEERKEAPAAPAPRRPRRPK